jgi:hypothetical protein
MNARERYDSARAAAGDGRYEEALRGYAWFHDHALEEQPSLYGVRLSYALSDWIELASHYPPAMVELKAVRDAKSDRLAQGVGNRDLFHDVEAINEQLDDQVLTYDLFVRLLETNPALAYECADLAMPAIVKSKHFSLARKFIRDPEGAIRNWSQLLNEDVADLAKKPPSKAPRLDAYIHFYVTRVRLLLDVLNGVDELGFADALRERALAFVESTPVRDAVSAALKQAA